MTPRADARRNYERLLTAAAKAFDKDGAHASLDDIAKAAGVGNATLYRHFPTREKLIEAVFDGRIQALCQTGRDLLTSPPGEAVRQWQSALISHIIHIHGLADALLVDRRGTAPPQFADWHRAMEQTAGDLLDRAQATGVVRPDLTARELIQLTSAVATTTGPTQDQAERLLSLLMDGLTTRQVPEENFQN